MEEELAFCFMCKKDLPFDEDCNYCFDKHCTCDEDKTFKYEEIG